MKLVMSRPHSACSQSDSEDWVCHKVRVNCRLGHGHGVNEEMAPDGVDWAVGKV